MATPQKVYQYKDQGAFTRVLLGALCLDGAAVLYRFSVLLTFREATNYTGEEVEMTGPQLALAIGDVGMLMMLVPMVISGFWIVQASRNAHSFGRKMKHSVAGSLGWYFVPVANLFLPYQAMSEIWGVSAPAGQLKTRLLPTWWALWLVANVLSNVVARTMDTPIPLLDAFSDALILASLVAFGLLVRRLDQMQRQTNATRQFSDDAPAENVLERVQTAG